MFKCKKCGKEFESLKKLTGHNAGAHTEHHTKGSLRPGKRCCYCGGLAGDMKTHKRLHCKRNPKSRSYDAALTERITGRITEKTAEKPKKREAKSVVPFWDDSKIKIAIPPISPKNIPNIYLPIKIILKVEVETK